MSSVLPDGAVLDRGVGAVGLRERERLADHRTRAFHIGATDVDAVVLEPFVGGRWYERGVDGTECDWGRVRRWDAPERVVFTWQINGAFRFDPDPEHASAIDVRFHADGPAETTVAVEHRGFERLVGGQAVHDTINGGGGWALLLDTYAKSVA